MCCNDIGKLIMTWNLGGLAPLPPPLNPPMSMTDQKYILTRWPFQGEHTYSWHRYRTLFAPVTLTLIWWPWYMNLTEILRRCTCLPSGKNEKTFQGQGFQKLQHYRQTDTQTDATENITMPHLRVVKSRHQNKPHQTANVSTTSLKTDVTNSYKMRFLP